MHIFDESDGPTVTLTLPRSLAVAMNEALRRYVPVSAGIDQALTDEIDMQLQDRGGNPMPADQVLVVGDPIDGIKHYAIDGPDDLAIEQNFANDTWWVAEVHRMP